MTYRVMLGSESAGVVMTVDPTVVSATSMTFVLPGRTLDLPEGTPLSVMLIDGDTSELVSNVLTDAFTYEAAAPQPTFAVAVRQV